MSHLRRLLVGTLTSCAVLLALALTLTSGHVAAAPRADIPACDPIAANTTWTTGNSYVLNNCSLFVNAGATLTIQPGVTVKFGGGNSGARINGALVANGTAAQPVVFTSVADGAPGDWYGIIVPAGGSATLAHAAVRYAGGAAFNAALDGWSEAQIETHAGSQFSLTDATLHAGGRMALYFNGAGQTPTLHNVHISDHTTSDWSFRFTALQSTVNMQPDYANVTFSGNVGNAVTVGGFTGELAQDVTLGGAPLNFNCGYSLCVLSVPAGRTLAVAPGTTLDFGPPTGIIVNSGGTLRAEGSVGAPIIFTSLAAAAGADAHWNGLWAQAGSTLRLAHCEVAWAFGGNFGLGGLEINTGDAQVSDCRIHHNRDDGVVILAKDGNAIAPTLTRVDATDNGGSGAWLEARNGGVNTPTWNGGRLNRNGRNGVHAYVQGATLSPTLRNLTVNNNGRNGESWNDYLDGLSLSTTNGFSNLNPTLENITLSGNPGYAARWSCDGSIVAHNLTATDNGSDALNLRGCTVNGGRQWDVANAGVPVEVSGNIDIAANGLLTLTPGSELRFGRNQYDWRTQLNVLRNGSLIARGTPDAPIVLRSITPAPGAWGGITVQYAGATLILGHCEIAYGGGSGPNPTGGHNVHLYGHSAETPGPIAIENCAIHHSSGRGVRFDYVRSAPVVRGNRFEDNAQEAVVNYNSPPLDARANWWGHASGPFHATQNPAGVGQTVGDNILFYPWLTTPDGGGAAEGEFMLSVASPNRFNPGQTVDYAVHYLNLRATPVNNALLIVRLPHTATYAGSTGGGIYWPQRHVVFWRLGNIAPGAQALLTFGARFDWGIPGGLSDGIAWQVTADNYNAGAFDRAPYDGYAPFVMASTGALSAAQWQAQLAANAELNTLHQRALAAGFRFAAADRVRLTDGRVIVQAILLAPDAAATRILYADPAAPYAVTFSPGQYTAEDADGGVRWEIAANTRTFFGDWIPLVRLLNQSPRDQLTGCRGAGCCLSNCLSKVMLTAVAGKLSRAVESGLTAYDCYRAKQSPTADNLAKCAGQIRQKLLQVNDVPVLGELIGITECLAQCGGNPTSHDCTDALVTCEPNYANLYSYVGIPTKTVYECQGGCYSPRPGFVPCALDECCVPGIGCSDDCKQSTFVPAKDPNDIAGPVGDLLPGQTVTYTIRYENVGAGRAYGVFVSNVLPTAFDAASVTFVHGAGSYLPDSRELLWYVGELGPQGAADSQGVITYSVALTVGLPSGTPVVNRAVVSFPSVPEQTPTNDWVNVVAPLVAHGQALATNYMTPRAIVLHGVDVSGLPLTYAIVDPPQGGTLGGTPPNVTYTPGADFVGTDGFSFAVSNGSSTSRPAQVRLDVRPAGDTTRPALLWTLPADGATAVATSADPLASDAGGPLHAPFVRAAFSEPLAAATVTAANVRLARGGTPVTAGVWYDAATRQIVLAPRAPLPAGEYTVTIAVGVTDVAGNAPAAALRWTFTIGTPAPEYRLYLPVVRRP